VRPIICAECGAYLGVELDQRDGLEVKPCDVCVQAAREAAIGECQIAESAADVDAYKAGRLDGEKRILERVLDMCRDNVPRRTRKVLVAWAEGQLAMIGRV